MSDASSRGGPRAQQRRGPRGGSSRPDPKAQAERIARHDAAISQIDAPDRHLARFHEHFAQNYAEDQDDGLNFRITRAIVVAARRWRKLANERVKAVDQTMARWETLFLVAFADEELTQSDLAKLISIEGPTLVRMLDLLAKDGLIERRQSDADRRVTTNAITPAGRAVIGEIMQITNTLRSEVLADIPKEDLAVALSVLSRVIRSINALR